MIAMQLGVTVGVCHLFVRYPWQAVSSLCYALTSSGISFSESRDHYWGMSGACKCGLYHFKHHARIPHIFVFDIHWRASWDNLYINHILLIQAVCSNSAKYIDFKSLQPNSYEKYWRTKNINISSLLQVLLFPSWVSQRILFEIAFISELKGYIDSSESKVIQDMGIGFLH